MNDKSMNNYHSLLLDRMNLVRRNYKDVLDCTKQMLEDMYYPYIFKVFSEFRPNIGIYENFIWAIAQIASDPKSGVMGRDAEMVLAIILLKDKADVDKLRDKYIKWGTGIILGTLFIIGMTCSHLYAKKHPV